MITVITGQFVANASKTNLNCDNNIGVASATKSGSQEIILPSDSTQCTLSVTDKDGKTQDCTASLTLKTNALTCSLNFRTISISNQSNKVNITWSLFNLAEAHLICGNLFDEVIPASGLWSRG